MGNQSTRRLFEVLASSLPKALSLVLTMCQSLAFALPIDSSSIRLEKPINCQLGSDCIIQNYVDLAPGAEYSDESCGSLTYDKHKGTDFRISFDQMKAGVAVKAAASGVVRGMRDGLEDISIRQNGLAAVKDRECGNGVLLVHADGFETQYCHMRKGSILVKVGQQVTTGQELGLVGLSGQTEFPHLHFQVRVNGNYVSPFTGRAMESGCSVAGNNPLWSDQALKAMPYIATGSLDAGFSIEQPNIDTIFVSERTTDQITSKSPQLIFWAAFWGAQKGDDISLRIVTPSGAVWTLDSQVVPRNKAQLIASLIQKYTKPWPIGTYRGEAVLKRQGTVIASISRSMSVD